MTQICTNIKSRISRLCVTLLATTAIVVSAAIFCVAYRTETASAASISGFKAGNIISDAVMGNYNSMSVTDIQNFLTSKNPCNNTNYALYVSMTNTYKTVNWHWDNGHFVCLSEERFGSGTTIGSGQTAAEIIYEAAQTYRINPQVLIVLLEKEQGLITDTYPHSGQYRSATGYGCPDTAACDSKYYGFKNQVMRAAELFRYTLDNGYYAYPEKTSGVYVAYNPSASCGRSEVYIENRATAALYRYTPYQPNSAALAAGYGLGDSCSAYGNRNFYLYFTDWFGSTQTAPLGVSKESAILPDGTYSLVSSQNPSLSLAVTGKGTVNGTNAESNASGTQWTFQRNASTGYYKITDANSGKVLDLSNANTNSGANVQIWSYDSNTCAQRWKPYQLNDGSLVIESACSADMVLSMSSLGASANIQLAPLTGDSTQKWKFYVGQTISNGIYTMRSAVSSGSVVDTHSNSTSNGGNIHIWQESASPIQKWQFTYTNGYYVIKDIHSGKVLDLSNAKLTNGTNLQIWSYDSNTCAQRWQVLRRDDGSYSIFSACGGSKAIDLSNASVANGTNIQLWSYDPNTKAQRWSLAANPVLADGTYTIYSRLGFNKTIDLSNASTLNGANIQTWTYDSATTAQKWNLHYDATSGTYTITNAGNGKAIDVSNARMVDGNNIQLWAQDNNTCAQKWNIIETSSGVYSIHSACQSNYTIDVVNASVFNGVNIHLCQSNLTNAQRWVFTKR